MPSSSDSTNSNAAISYSNTASSYSNFSPFYSNMIPAYSGLMQTVPYSLAAYGIPTIRYAHPTLYNPAFSPSPFMSSPYYVYRFARDGSGRNPKEDRTMCAFFKEHSVLSCKSPTGMADCETASNFEDFSSTKFESFGIGKSSEGKFSLFPRKLDNTAFLSDSSDKKNAKSKLSIFADEKLTDFGLKLKDNECFKKIEEVLTGSLRNEIVHLEDASSKENKTAYLIAELMVINEVIRSEREVSPK